jgi:hypothetical protein
MNGLRLGVIKKNPVVIIESTLYELSLVMNENSSKSSIRAGFIESHPSLDKELLCQ